MDFTYAELKFLAEMLNEYPIHNTKYTYDELKQRLDPLFVKLGAKMTAFHPQTQKHECKCDVEKKIAI